MNYKDRMMDSSFQIRHICFFLLLSSIGAESFGAGKISECNKCGEDKRICIARKLSQQMPNDSSWNQIREAKAEKEQAKSTNDEDQCQKDYLKCLDEHKCD